MNKVFITRPISGPAEDILRDAGCELDICNKQYGLSKKALIKALSAKKYDAMISSLTDSIDKDVIDAFGGKLIVNYAVGFNNIDTAYAKEKGIFVTNTPTSSDAVAEFAVALVLALERKLFSADAFVKRGSFKGFDAGLFLGHDMRGKVLGIVGTGRIGGTFARIMAKGFHVNVVYSDISKNDSLEKECGASMVSLEELLRISDIVSLHVPLTPKTTHLIGEKEFSIMRKGVLLINTARGPVVDEHALVTALQNCTVGGAGLDVFEFEPKVTRALLKLPNVIVTPHIASATVESRRNMARLAAENVIDVVSGKTPRSLVN